MSFSLANQTDFRRRLILSMALPVLLLAIISGALIWQVFNLLASAKWLDHSDEVIAQADETEKQFFVVRADVQEYLLTGRSDFLEPYKRARESFESSVARLQVLVADNPVQIRRAREIESIYSSWQEVADARIRPKGTGDNYQAVTISGAASQYLDRIADEFASFIETERSLRSARSDQTRRGSRTVVIAALGLSLLVGGFIAAFTRRQLIGVSNSYSRALAGNEQALRELKQSEEQYRLLFDENPLPMWVFDRETLAFLRVNEAAVRHYGYSRDEFLAMTVNDVRPDADRPRLASALSRADTGLPVSGEWRHRKKDGSIIDVEVTADRINLAGRTIEFVLANDVTERKRAERAILEMNDELELRVAERTSQLEATNKELESFSYTISHDLRAPLRAIDGFSRILLEDFGTALNEEPREYLHTVRENAQRMGELIDDLLAFSRLGKKPLQKRRVMPREIVDSVLQDLETDRAGRKVEIKIFALAECEADPALLKQVFANLLSNAIKYSRKREVAEIEVGCTNSGGNGRHTYFVKDNGVGFDMKYAHKLFGVFQRLHLAEEFEGTGVGLAIVQRIIHSHGGKVWAEAEVDKGAAFYFTLSGGGTVD